MGCREESVLLGQLVQPICEAGTTRSQFSDEIEHHHGGADPVFVAYSATDRKSQCLFVPEHPVEFSFIDRWSDDPFEAGER